MLIVRGFVEEAVQLLSQVDSTKLDRANRMMYEFLNVDEQHDAESFAAIAAEVDEEYLNPLEMLLICGPMTSAGDYRAACATVNRLYTQVAHQPDNFVRWPAALHRCRIYASAGKLREINQFSQSLLEEVDRAPPAMQDMFSFAYIARGRVLLARNELEEAERNLQQALQNIAKTGFIMGVLPAATSCRQRPTG